MNFTLKKTENYSIEASVLSKLIAMKNPDASLLYLFILKNSEISPANAMAELSMDEARFSHAIDALVHAQILEGKEKKILLDMPDEPPYYSPEDITATIENDKDFRTVLNFTQKEFGKILSNADTQILLGIYLWLGFSPEVIYLLVKSCANDCEIGSGRRLTMRFVQGRARNWYNLGLSTPDAVNKYLKEQEERNSAIGKIKKALQIQGRALTQSEEKFVSGWTAFSTDIIEKAYDITIMKNGKLVWKYMDTILQKWNEQGLDSISKIEEHEKDYRSKTPAKNGVVSPHEEKMRKRLSEFKKGLEE